MSLKKNTETKKIILTIFLFLSFPLIVFAIGKTNEGYKHSKNGYTGRKNYNEHGICKRVINSRANEVFIPTKTKNEWQKFITAAGTTPSVGLENLEASDCCYDNDSKKCHADELYWYNSCGELQPSDMAEDCEDGCVNDDCCDSNEYTECYAGDRWWYNSCGERQAKAEECNSVPCMDDECCLANSYTKCDPITGNRYNYDSCDTRRTLKQDCQGAGCVGDTCTVINCGGTWDDNAAPCNVSCGTGRYARKYNISVYPKNGGTACPNPLIEPGMGNVCTMPPCCTPKTCAQLGKQCGTWPSGCTGINTTCPNCPSGKHCNSTGQCVDDCTPKTCAQLTASGNCGTFDNCGTPITCNTCPGEQFCDPTLKKCIKWLCADPNVLSKAYPSGTYVSNPATMEPSDKKGWTTYTRGRYNYRCGYVCEDGEDHCFTHYATMLLLFCDLDRDGAIGLNYPSNGNNNKIWTDRCCDRASGCSVSYTVKPITGPIHYTTPNYGIFPSDDISDFSKRIALPKIQGEYVPIHTVGATHMITDITVNTCSEVSCHGGGGTTGAGSGMCTVQVYTADGHILNKSVPCSSITP